jgi:hypothetical protein
MSERACTCETVVVRGALAVIAVAVLDDAFAHREPGTATGDQLASGLVPVAVAGLLAAAYPRLRPGARAAVALSCGMLALVAGIADGVRHVVIDRLSGDDLTAMLAGVAGVALIVTAALTLWSARRRDEPRSRRYARRAAVALATVIVGFFVLLPLALAIVTTHKARSPVTAAFGRGVTLTTDDGLRLTASYAPSRNGAAVLVFPGREQTLPHARMLARHGYGVLLVDRRGEGESEGRLNLFGWDGEGDVRAAVAFLAAQPDVREGRIGGLGLSVGGELLLQAAASDTRLRAIVSEGAGIRSLAEHQRRPGIGALGRWLTPWVVQTAAVAALSDTLPPTDLTEAVGRIAPRPVLLIRATDGDEGEALNEVYAARIGPSAQRWIARGGHTQAFDADPGYERRVVGFFEEHLSARRP